MIIEIILSTAVERGINQPGALDPTANQGL